MAMSPREHIEEIRKKKFKIGEEPDPKNADLHHAVNYLSAELYAKDVHFLMELIQAEIVREIDDRRRGAAVARCVRSTGGGVLVADVGGSGGCVGGELVGTCVTVSTTVVTGGVVGVGQITASVAVVWADGVLDDVGKIYNAEDNEYREGVQPSLEFVITSRDITATGASATLLVFNNERGFSPKNVESICSTGRSTKKGHRKRCYIGEKE
ncbi:unnamed protein product [Camellia sinensis]